MSEAFQVFPVGVVRKRQAACWIEIFAPYAVALLGVVGFSHIQVLFWFHKNDTAKRRKTLRVHPRKDKNNPLSGVFATHSPLRPNPIGLTLCQIKSIDGLQIKIEDIDAFDGTPVIDIKCYIPSSVAESTIRLPDWV